VLDAGLYRNRRPLRVIKDRVTNRNGPDSREFKWGAVFGAEVHGCYTREQGDSHATHMFNPPPSPPTGTLDRDRKELQKKGQETGVMGRDTKPETACRPLADASDRQPIDDGLPEGLRGNPTWGGGVCFEAGFEGSRDRTDWEKKESSSSDSQNGRSLRPLRSSLKRRAQDTACEPTPIYGPTSPPQGRFNEVTAFRPGLSQQRAASRGKGGPKQVGKLKSSLTKNLDSERDLKQARNEGKERARTTRWEKSSPERRRDPGRGRRGNSERQRLSIRRRQGRRADAYRKFAATRLRAAEGGWRDPAMTE